MRFWDSSAVVPLLVHEATSDAMLATYVEDPDAVVWWATDVECVSALARLERESRLAAADVADAVERLAALTGAWHEVQPIARARQVAVRILRVHPLRAADALQLAAAVLASEDNPSSLPFVTLDDRLADAAAREGFPVVRVT